MVKNDKFEDQTYLEHLYLKQIYAQTCAKSELYFICTWLVAKYVEEANLDARRGTAESLFHSVFFTASQQMGTS